MNKLQKVSEAGGAERCSRLRIAIVNLVPTCSNFESDFGQARLNMFELCPWNAGSSCSSNPTYTSYMELNWHWHMCNWSCFKGLIEGNLCRKDVRFEGFPAQPPRLLMPAAPCAYGESQSINRPFGLGSFMSHVFTTKRESTKAYEYEKSTKFPGSRAHDMDAPQCSRVRSSTWPSSCQIKSWRIPVLAAPLCRVFRSRWVAASVDPRVENGLGIGRFWYTTDGWFRLI